jgi:hypothetical protein
MEQTTKILTFPREIGLKRAKCLSKQSYLDYIKKLNGKDNLYTSLYAYRDAHPEYHWKFDTESAILDRAWWDFDSGDRGSIEQVKKDVITLLSRISGDVRIVATGRGFHIHQLFERSVMGGHFHRHLERYQREMIRGLQTFDGFGNKAKLTRIPNTYNISRKRYCVSIPTDAFVADPDGFKIPNLPVKEYLKYDPFRGMPNTSDFDFVKWVADNPEPEVQLEEFKGEIGEVGGVPIMPCLHKGIHVENPSHKIRVAFVQHMAEELRWFADPTTVPDAERQQIEDTIFDYIKGLGWRDFKPNLTRKGIRTNMNYNNSPSCRFYYIRGLCGGKCWKYDGTIE